MENTNTAKARTFKTSVASAMAAAAAGIIAAVVMAGASPGVAQESPNVPGTPVPTEGGLALINYYRDLGNLPEVTENATWSAEASAHARYTVQSGTIAHSEDPASPYFTAEGDRAARYSNVTASANPSSSEAYLIGDSAVAPFHAMALLDPRLEQIGYGLYRDTASTSGLKSSVVLDVSRGNDDGDWTLSEPVTFPSAGKVSPFRTAAYKEWPDPLKACGYTAPAGAPVYVMLPEAEGEGPYNFEMRDSSGNTLEACAYDGKTYKNPVANDQRVGRYYLDTRNAIVILPKAPLVSNETYTVGVTTCERELEWSYGVATKPEEYTPVQGVDVTVPEPAACDQPPVDPPDTDNPDPEPPKPPVKPNAKPTVSGAKVSMAKAPRSKAAAKRPRPVLVSAIVRDRDSNLQAKNVVVKLDGKTVRKGVKYSPGSDRLSMKWKLRKGRHAVVVQARDAKGATVTKTIRFKVR